LFLLPGLEKAEKEGSHNEGTKIHEVVDMKGLLHLRPHSVDDNKKSSAGIPDMSSGFGQKHTPAPPSNQSQRATVTAVLTGRFSYARYRCGNRTSSTGIGDLATVAFSKAKRL
jgi:hypothetical protein